MLTSGSTQESVLTHREIGWGILGDCLRMAWLEAPRVVTMGAEELHGSYGMRRLRHEVAQIQLRCEDFFPPTSTIGVFSGRGVLGAR